MPMSTRLCALLLLLALPSPTLAAQPHSAVDVQAGPQAVSLGTQVYFRSRGRALVLRVPAGFRVAGLLLDGPALVIALRAGITGGARGVGLQRYDPQGRLLWSMFDEESDDIFLGPVWPVSGVMSYTTAGTGAFTTVDHLAINLHSGRVLPSAGKVLAESSRGQLLLLRPGPAVMTEGPETWLPGRWAAEIQELPYQVVSPEGEAEPQRFLTPPRPHCGEYRAPDFGQIGSSSGALGVGTQEIPLVLGLFAHAGIQGEELYARREDACGPFTYRFRWTRPGPPEVSPGWSGPASDPAALP
ncbi:hypothetical protein DGo_CA0150 [Deinococcus gobiensis I-0]|uniref:Uncharacterized protein n=2 Tax=Deinococcus TaxID=1298 RepID=H8GTC7_DEIGI|nr:hypothetical protein DGo_CA0150 [Deinococcus gobiensis I-0]